MRVIANLDDFLARVFQIGLHSQIVGIAAPVLTNYKNIHIQLSAARNIFKFVVGAHNVDAAQGLQHFHALFQRDNWNIGLIQIYDLIRGNADGHLVSQLFAMVQQGKMPNMQQVKCAKGIYNRRFIFLHFL